MVTFDSNSFAVRHLAQLALYSADYGTLPHMVAMHICFRPVPEEANFAPRTALIFINNISEKVGEK